MALAKGVAKKISFKRETAWAAVPVDKTGAQYLPRVTGQFNVTAEALQSATIRSDYQSENYRLGTRSGDGSLNAELSPGVYEEFFAAALAKDFAAGGATVGATVTIAASGDFFTLTRDTGSWLTDGFYVGNVVRLTGVGLNAANAGNNILVLSMTALVATVRTFAENTLVAEGPIAAVDVAVVGKQTYTPQTGHISPSFSIEEFFEDIAISELHLGNKVNTVAVSLPTSGFCTADFSFMSKGKTVNGTTGFFTSPAQSPNTGSTVSVSGAVIVNGVPAGVITSASLNIDRALEPANVIGTNHAVEIFDGRVTVTGDFSTYLMDGTFRDYFLNETRISLVIALTTGSEKDANVMTFVMPSVQLGSSSRNDGEGGIVQDHSFQALLNTNTATGLVQSTLLVQDTTLV